MEDQVAFVSRDGKSRIKLEYVEQGEKRIRLWEAKHNKALETLFDENGYILVQKLLDVDNELALNKRVADALREARISGTKETQYTEVKFSKPCPNCNENKLSRYVEAFASKNEVPIMPIYQCSSCKTKSYYLTSNYLEYLVDNNKELFNEAELSELNKDKSAFMGELKGYIIRIFASKKIMCIK